MLKNEKFEIELAPTRLPEVSDDLDSGEIVQKTSPGNAPGKVIEDILDRIGLGKFHWLSYAVISVFWLCDGAEVIALSLLNYILVHVVWFVDLNDIGMLGSAIFGGFFLGSIISGPISSAYGRRKPFLIYMILVFALGVLSALAPNFTFLLVTRALYGVLVGILSPLTSSMITEITPKAKRGINFVFVSTFFTVGEVIAIFLASVLKVEENTTRWRGLLIWASVPALISLALGCKFLEESPRYLLLKDADKGIHVLNLMHRANKKTDLHLTDTENEEIHNFVEKQKEKAAANTPLKELFSKKNLRITICLWVSWWVLNFVYYGILYVLPLVLAKIKSEATDGADDSINYSDLLISALGEVPSYALVIAMIENQKFGRKLSLTLSFALTGFCCFGAHLFVEEAFLLFVFFAKFFACSAFSFIYPLTSELYHTSCRTTGLGFASGISRIGGVLMPWITIWALKISPTFTFVTFGAFCMIATGAVMLLPYDTTGKELDQEDD